MKNLYLNFWQQRCWLLLAKISAWEDSLNGVVRDLEKRGIQTDSRWVCAYRHLKSAAQELGVGNV
jgi:hypothetical protein